MRDMTGKHVRPKHEPKPEKSKTKPFKPVLILEYNNFSGGWDFTVIMPYRVTSSMHSKYQNHYDAETAAREAWESNKPTDPAPPVAVCYTHEQYYAEILKAGWK